MMSTVSSLVNGFLLSFILTGAIWCGLRLSPRRILNAATRYTVWWIAMLCVLALPYAHLSRKPAARGLPHPASAHAVAGALHIAPVNIAVSAAPDAPAAALVVPISAVPVSVRPGEWIWRLIVIWPVVSALLLVRLAMSFVLLSRMKRRALEAPAELREQALAWRSHCGGRRKQLRVLISKEIATPVAAGPFHPAILLPARLMDELTTADLNRIGLHETAHLMRRDDYALLVERAIEAVFFFHPLILWIARSIDLEREIACDDLVIASTGQPRTYAACLTRIVESDMRQPALWPAAPAAENSSQLGRRVAALLDKTRRAGAHLMKVRAAACATLLLVIALAALEAPALVAFVPRFASVALSGVLPARRLTPVLPVPQQALSETGPQALPATGPAGDPAGTIVEDSSGSPIASAELRFKKSGMRELAADLESDRQGRFSAPGLPPGDYSVEVSKANFGNVDFRLHVPTPTLSLRLTHYGAVEGKVTDAAGRAIPGILRGGTGRTVGGARVAILQKSPDTGALTKYRDLTPEDEGAWRVYTLPPGEYAVGLWYWGLEQGSGMQLYPDNSHPRFFTVKGGEEYTGVDFTVIPQPSAHIAGKVEIPSGDEGPFQLALAMPEQPLLPLAVVISDQDGTFRFDKIPPGSYDLLVSGPARGYGIFETVFSPEASAWFGHARIQAAGLDIDNLAVSVAPAKTLNVILRADGAEPEKPPEGCPQAAQISAHPIDAWDIAFASNPNHRAGFVKPQPIGNLVPGKVRLSANVGENCFQMSDGIVDLGGDTPAQFEIKVAAAGSVRGSVRAAAPGTRVSLTASTGESRPARTIYTGPDGRFEFTGLRPGAYRIAAGNSPIIDINVKGGAATEVELR